MQSEHDCIFLFLFDIYIKSIYQTFMDLINDAPIVSLNGDEFVGVEGEDYVNRVITKLGMDKSSVQNLY